jgi:hypothetical protein
MTTLCRTTVRVTIKMRLSTLSLCCVLLFVNAESYCAECYKLSVVLSSVLSYCYAEYLYAKYQNDIQNYAIQYNNKNTLFKVTFLNVRMSVFMLNAVRLSGMVLGIVFSSCYAECLNAK